MYVWLDALTNYITATGFPDEQKRYIRNFGQLVFIWLERYLAVSRVYWPAFLLAAGLEPPKRVFAHGWWTNEGQKISKSLGNVIDPIELVEKYGLDQVSIFIARSTLWK